MARKRFDTAPVFNIDDESVVFQKVQGSTVSLFEVKDHDGSALFTIHNSGAVTMPQGLSGTPTASTAAVNTNSTQVATTAFVMAQYSETNLEALKDVVVTSIATGDLLRWNGTAWVNDPELATSDRIITIGGVATLVADDNKDRGVEFRWHTGAAAKTGFFGYDDSTGYFTFIPQATNTANVISGTAGDIQATNFRGALVGNADTASALFYTRTISLTGSVTGTVNTDLSGNVSIATSIAANSIALGTETTGNYVSGVTQGTGITVTHTAGEGSSADIALNATLDNLSDTTVPSPTSGDFLKWNGTAWVNDPINLGTDTVGDYVASLTEGTGVTIINNSGETTSPTISIGQAVSPNDNVIFNNVTVGGNLTVTGSTVNQTTATLDVANNKITLNANVTGAPTSTGEIEINRGSSTDVRLRWNETLDLWEYTNDGTYYYRIGSALMTVSTTPPASPYEGDLWFESDSGLTFVRYDSFWIEIGTSGIGVVTGSSAPPNPANGQAWYNSSSQTLSVYYGGAWVQVGAATLAGSLPLAVKGDIVVGIGSGAVAALSTVQNGYVLQSDSAQSTGLKWVSADSVSNNAAIAVIMGAF